VAKLPLTRTTIVLPPGAVDLFWHKDLGIVGKIYYVPGAKKTYEKVERGAGLAQLFKKATRAFINGKWVEGYWLRNRFGKRFFISKDKLITKFFKQFGQHKQEARLSLNAINSMGTVGKRVKSFNVYPTNNHFQAHMNGLAAKAEYNGDPFTEIFETVNVYAEHSPIFGYSIFGQTTLNPGARSVVKEITKDFAEFGVTNKFSKNLNLLKGLDMADVTVHEVTHGAFRYLQQSQVPGGPYMRGLGKYGKYSVSKQEKALSKKFFDEYAKILDDAQKMVEEESKKAMKRFSGKNAASTADEILKQANELQKLQAQLERKAEKRLRKLGLPSKYAHQSTAQSTLLQSKAARDGAASEGAAELAAMRMRKVMNRKGPSGNYFQTWDEYEKSHPELAKAFLDLWKHLGGP